MNRPDRDVFPLQELAGLEGNPVDESELWGLRAIPGRLAEFTEPSCHPDDSDGEDDDSCDRMDYDYNGPYYYDPDSDCRSHHCDDDHDCDTDCDRTPPRSCEQRNFVAEQCAERS